MGLSITQILFTVAAIVLAWRVIGFLERRQKASPPARREPERKEVEGTVELEACPRCGTYVEKGRTCPHCGTRATLRGS